MAGGDLLLVNLVAASADKVTDHYLGAVLMVVSTISKASQHLGTFCIPPLGETRTLPTRRCQVLGNFPTWNGHWNGTTLGSG